MHKIHYDLPLKTRLLLQMMKPFRAGKLDASDLKSLHKLRKDYPEFWPFTWVLGKKAALKKQYDQLIPLGDAQRKARFYIPLNTNDANPAPVILNYHGGGWTVGTLQLNDWYCSHLSALTGAIVVSIDYRLAPEHPFPTPGNDAYDALCWVAENAAIFGGDGNRLGVTGDSAGGNLSAVVSLMARDKNGPKISYQALIYPGTDGTFNYESYHTHTEAPILPKTHLDFYRATYEGKEGDRLEPYFSPGLAEDHSNLPPALVITAGYDPLYDDGRIYAEKLKAAGTPAKWINFEKDIHGFMSLPNHCISARPALKEIVKGFLAHL